MLKFHLIIILCANYAYASFFISILPNQFPYTVPLVCDTNVWYTDPVIPFAVKMW